MCPVVASLTLLGDRDAAFFLMFLYCQIKYKVFMIRETKDVSN